MGESIGNDAATGPDSAADLSARPVLGLEGGGTRTTVLLAARDDEVLVRFDSAPANLRLMEPGELEAHLRGIAERLPEQPGRIGIGLAGVRLDSDHARLRSAVDRVWPGVACATSDDLVTALEAVDWHPDCRVQVLVLSGTGSCIAGRSRDGEAVKVGGRGHVLGDRASACDIAQHALRAVMTISDIDDEWPALGADILAHLQMNEPEDLIDWSMVATKTELASVAIPVFEAAKSRKDEIACAVLKRAVERLTKDAGACVDRIADEADRIQFVLNGAVLLKNSEFLNEVTGRLHEQFPNAVFSPLKRPSVWGAVALARMLSADPATAGNEDSVLEDPSDLKTVAASPTEQRNPRSMNFGEMPIADGIRLMLAEDATIPDAIFAELPAIEWTVKQVVRAFGCGGRLIYAGAGTSGRLGVLDASECPPTFRAPREQVQGIIAGGRPALWSAVEGAEDDAAAGRRAISGKDVSEQDVVVGITASGHAPFVWGCLREAKKRGAATVLLCCNPAHREHPLPDQAITPDTGPEVLTGSTRLKAGTATKLVLNLITTLAMTHSGKVLSNLMVDLNPSNTKLRDRAVRIVREITGASVDVAQEALEAAEWVVRDACLSLQDKSRDVESKPVAENA